MVKGEIFMVWMKASTAPLDGTIVDLWFEGEGRVADCWFGKDRNVIGWRTKEGYPVQERLFLSSPKYWMTKKDPEQCDNE